jgi:beta-ureidopropionase / N-carbamoyl-L-amino-acid hydrolase
MRKAHGLNRHDRKCGAFNLDYAHPRTDVDRKTIKEELERLGFPGEMGCSFEENPSRAHLGHIEQGISMRVLI